MATNGRTSHHIFSCHFIGKHAHRIMQSNRNLLLCALLSVYPPFFLSLLTVWCNLSDTTGCWALYGFRTVCPASITLSYLNAILSRSTTRMHFNVIQWLFFRQRKTRISLFLLTLGKVNKLKQKKQNRCFFYIVLVFSDQFR